MRYIIILLLLFPTISLCQHGDSTWYNAIGKIDSNGLKQGLWEYYFINKTHTYNSQLSIPIILSNGHYVIDTTSINNIFQIDSSVYETGNYRDNKRIGLWKFIKYQMESWVTFFPDGSCLLQDGFADIYFNSDSTEIHGTVRSSRNNYTSVVLECHSSSESNCILCKIYQDNGKLLDKFCSFELEWYISSISSGAYNNRIKNNP